MYNATIIQQTPEYERNKDAKMKIIKSFQVVPALPDELLFLKELAYNFWWSWDSDSMQLFRQIDEEIWDKCEHNPVELLASVGQLKLHELARDEGFLLQLKEVEERFRRYMEQPSSKNFEFLKKLKKHNGISRDTTWFSAMAPGETDLQIAYFSLEFGITECLKIYSGGLGLLAGDHLKSASDLGLPLVAVGLLYSEGYFQQYLNLDGWQQEAYPVSDFHALPITLEKDKNGEPIEVSVMLAGTKVFVQVWRAQVGRVPLYLLDTNVPKNSEEHRQLTARLYGGDWEHRLKQELILGFGGPRALRKLGIAPTVFHLNEGHAAFTSIERIAELILEKKLTFDEAKSAVAAATIFTTHTPVPAGNEKYSRELIHKYFGDFYTVLGISEDEFLKLGKQATDNPNEDFGMTVLALNLSNWHNGVSELHGAVSRNLWKNVWPEVPLQEIPIISITNGVHPPTWVSHELAELFDRYLGPRWKEEPGNQEVWNRVERIPVSELWRTHERRRERVVAFARDKLVNQLRQRGASQAEIKKAREVLDPEALTIGFARRFATYKRGYLIFKDIDRLTKILTNREKPVQIIIAGKAHPHDDAGKYIIQQIIHTSRRPELRRHIVFIEDYNIDVARYLVQGVDVWLNTPRRPLEASGTSGMKAALNGAINLSVLDGWWAEAYNVDNGYAIGAGENYDDPEYQDLVESSTLYHLLEEEVVPLFYHRGADDIPRGWVSMMKKSMLSLSPRFNTNRMVVEYTHMFYLPAQQRWSEFSKDDFAIAKNVGKQLHRYAQHWKNIEFVNSTCILPDELVVGKTIKVSTIINLPGLSTDEISVEICIVRIKELDEIDTIISRVPMECVKVEGSQCYFEGEVTCDKSGNFGVALRVLPQSDYLEHPVQGLILWDAK